jgi:hypothetical protein
MGCREGFIDQNTTREEEKAVVRYMEAVGARG